MTNPDGTVATQGNPLLQGWSTPFGMPPFAEIEPAHFRPAFEQAFAEQRQEIEAIAGHAEPPTFANTIEAIERSGASLDKVAAVFFNLAGSHTNPALEAIEREIAPLLARHRNTIYLNEALFARIAELFRQRATLGLTPEQDRVLERYHTLFRRNGGGLAPEVKERLAAIGERLASLGTRFGQNVLADERSYTLPLKEEADLAGLPDALRAAARQAAADRGLDGHVVTLARSSVEPFLQFSTRRDLREQAFRAWQSRGEGEGDADNRAIVAETVALRAERAKLLGYPTFSHFRLDDSMAKTPEAALGLLDKVWTPARAKALREAAALQDLVTADGGNFEVAPWDWRFYAERQRKAEFDFDEGEIKPYLQLDRMVEAVFDTAQRLFGVTFTERPDLPRYHPDVRVWEVKAGERHVGLFLGDYYARPSKRSGAWASSFRRQEKLSGDIRPIIVNVLNFSKAGDGKPALLSLDDARTLFHEFGHALHALLSDVTYPMLAGTSVVRDFVEFPSQLYEHWLEQPQVLERFARHHETGEPMPRTLVERALAARTFNQGFATVEYVASAMVDFDFHLLTDTDGLDVTAFEKKTLDRIGMPAAIAMRHRTPHFTHAFAGDGYSSAYYSYLWSEVLDADGFDAFEEAGDIFDPKTAERLKTYVYAAGGSRDPAEAYQLFRGRLPEADALLRKRGLAA